ncbi:hypothetical protein LEMLEM_LOCUS12384 [Lemmus lemmus]
MEIPI